INGASASLARRRAISVLPTPVGPIIRMFFGVISWRSGSATCWRRQRLRKAMATARLARLWPTTCLSSSETISLGVMCMMAGILYDTRRLIKRLNDVVQVGIDTQLTGNHQRFPDDVGRSQIGVLLQRLRSRLGKDTARTDGAN